MRIYLLLELRPQKCGYGDYAKHCRTDKISTVRKNFQRNRVKTNIKPFKKKKFYLKNAELKISDLG